MKKYTSNNSTKIDIDFLNQYWRIYERILFNETINDQLINIKNTIINVNQNKGIIFISVSGTSKNLVKGLEYAKNKGIISVSLTGSEFHNPLRKNCDHSLWVDSKSYNIVESIHTIYITIIIDLIIGKHEYSVV